MPQQLTILTTSECQAKCAHCLVRSGPERHDRLTAPPAFGTAVVTPGQFPAGLTELPDALTEVGFADFAASFTPHAVSPVAWRNAAEQLPRSSTRCGC